MLNQCILIWKYSGTSLITDILGTKTFVLISEVSLFPVEIYMYKVGTHSSVLIFRGVLLREVPLFSLRFNHNLLNQVENETNL